MPRMLETINYLYDMQYLLEVFSLFCCVHLNTLLQMLVLMIGGPAHEIGEQRMLRLACACAQSRMSFRFSYAQRMNVEKGSDKKHRPLAPLDTLEMDALRLHLRRKKLTF